MFQKYDFIRCEDFSVRSCVLQLEGSILAGMKSLKTLSLFSGGGGLDLGFAASGFKILACVEKDPYSCNTLKINAGRRKFLDKPLIINEDITKVNGASIIKTLGLKVGDLDLIIGGPPCQAFSVFGRRAGLSDPRGNLIWEYLRLIRETMPMSFVLENVSGLKTIDDGKLYLQLLEALTCDGQYTVSAQDYHVANYGIPQFRHRVFFVGHRKGKILPRMQESHGDSNLFGGLIPYVASGDALRGLPKPGPSVGIANHIGRLHSPVIVQRYRGLRFGERDPKTRINKLDPERPSFTIIVGSDAGGGKGHVHPYQPREVTPRESARMQTFPDWWEFYGQGRHVIRQVGNAVPPLFAAQLAQHLLRHFFGVRNTLNYSELVELLELNYLEKCSPTSSATKYIRARKRGQIS